MANRGRGPKPDMEKRANVFRLRAEGMTLAQIGRRMGLSEQRIHVLLIDATESTVARADKSPSRKTQLRRAARARCQACGKTMVGRHKPRPNHTLCDDCRERHNAITREKKLALVAAGLCVNCQQPRKRDGRLCTRCHQDYMRRYR